MTVSTQTRGFARLSVLTALALQLVCVSDAAAQAVRSFLEIRRENVVIQNWDLSCGAAALATLLAFQHDDPVPEREIAEALINRPEYLAMPEIVRLRQGFSLLDLKRYVDNRGYLGVGLGQLSLQNLIDRAPIIVPLNLLGYNHFVVFRGVLGNRVLLSDPAWGNRTMLVSSFERAWIDYPELGNVGFLVTNSGEPAPPGSLVLEPEDFVMLN